MSADTMDQNMWADRDRIRKRQETIDSWEASGLSRDEIWRRTEEFDRHHPSPLPKEKQASELPEWLMPGETKVTLPWSEVV